MIDLFGCGEASVLGVAAMLDAERIGYRRLETLESIDRHDPRPLLVTGSLDAAEITVPRNRRALVLCGGRRYARDVIGATSARIVENSYDIPVTSPPWSAASSAAAAAFGHRVLRVPRAAGCLAGGVDAVSTVAMMEADGEDAAFPLAARRGSHLWSALDLGAAFAHLLDESYAPAAPAAAGTPAAAQALYYAAPAALRGIAQRFLYRRAHRRLRDWDRRASHYPVDATGWLLLELLKGLLRLSFGPLARVEHWPSPFCSAATLTHDLEPVRFSYTRGLDRLMTRVGDRPRGHAFGMVAQAAHRLLTDQRRSNLGDYEIYCHGLTHRGDPASGRERASEMLRAARRRLERRLGRRVDGYRSPRLDRSSDLAWALDAAGFVYDSSFPDVDRENLDHFGSGVRWNLPYRPLIADARAPLRRSRCLELPLTAPDCVQPLFAGESVSSLRDSIAVKAAFIRRTGGVYVSLVHAGVFGDADAERREELLRFITDQLERKHTWLATPGQIADWWRRREGLTLGREGDRLVAINTGDQPIHGAGVALESGRRVRRALLPALEPGDSIYVDRFC